MEDAGAAGGGEADDTIAPLLTSKASVPLPVAISDPPGATWIASFPPAVGVAVAVYPPGATSKSRCRASVACATT